MSKYADVAIHAAQLAAQGALSPNEAWEQASSGEFGAGTSSQVKGCPRETFLSLCQDGCITGVPAGQYTQSAKNRAYAQTAVHLLRSNPELANSAAKLWQWVTVGNPKKHNSQMNVVIALWEGGFIKPS